MLTIFPLCLSLVNPIISRDRLLACSSLCLCCLASLSSRVVASNMVDINLRASFDDSLLRLASTLDDLLGLCDACACASSAYVRFACSVIRLCMRSLRSDDSDDSLLRLASMLDDSLGPCDACACARFAVHNAELPLSPCQTRPLSCLSVCLVRCSLSAGSLGL